MSCSVTIHKHVHGSLFLSCFFFTTIYFYQYFSVKLGKLMRSRGETLIGFFARYH